MKEKTLPVLIKELDDVFSKWIRRRDTGPDGKISCFICGKKLKVSEAQNMHFINRDNMPTRYDEINNHSGCQECNCYDTEHPRRYYVKMVETYGLKTVEALSAKACGLQKYTRPELQELINFYRSELRLKNEEHII